MAKAAVLKAAFRSGLEEWLAAELDSVGIPFDYEKARVPFVVPQREAKYLPDFECPGGIFIEGKGWFKTAAERQKYILVRESNPGMDIRFLFQDARKPIYKGSKTNYGDWADKHGFKWTDKRRGVPREWLLEMKQALKQQQQKGKR